jgi:hypothetical protein
VAAGADNDGTGDADRTKLDKASDWCVMFERVQRDFCSATKAFDDCRRASRST